MDIGNLEFREIYNQFQPKILRYLTRMVGEGEAEDLTQEVFAKVASALSTFRGEAQLSTWIYRIATNCALDKLRSAAAPAERSSEWQDGIAARSPWTGEAELTLEAQVYRQEMNDCVRGFVARLPENYRTVLLLGDFEGLKLQQIAEILDTTLDTVKVRLHRARRRLKQELREHCGPEWTESNEFLPELKRTEA